MSALKELQNYTFVSKYARYLPEKNRRETWKEAVDRVRNMMLKKYDTYGINEEINWAYDMMQSKKVLGSQRALQYGGKPIEKINARLYNCFHKDTKFVSSKGVISFADCQAGEELLVLTHTGQWQKAKVRYGQKQQIVPFKILRKGCEPKTFWTTLGHQWLLQDGRKVETDDLYCGDELVAAPDIFTKFDYDNSSPDERLYWAYGYTYGDGTRVQDNNGNNKYSMVRLCDHQIKYKYRFEELGFSTSTSLSLDGDFIAFTGKYQKTSPNPEIDEPRLIRAFVRGYLDADGALNRNYTNNIYNSIQSSEIDHIEFIRKCFPIAGIYIVSEEDLTGQETNYGIRPHTIKFRISNAIGEKYCSKFKVGYIDKSTNIIDDVWCLEVENDHTFILENGLVTGNCVSSYCDRLRFFQECFWLLLCGSGTGFSVQRHHIAKLPSMVCRLRTVDRPKKVFTPEDTIEGWADCLGVLIASYFDEQPEDRFLDYYDCDVVFNFKNIRPEGSYLSSGVGKAPGPEPLKRALDKIRSILEYKYVGWNPYIASPGTMAAPRLTSVEAYDIVMHSSDAVLSGGVRRSSTICVFSPDDEAMAKAKTGDWRKTNPQRARSNNSAILLRNKTTYDEFFALMQNVKEYGEPGFIWVDHIDFLMNPCGEIGMYPVDITTGKSGWQGCNLSTINCGSIKDEADFYDRCRAAAIIGTLQAGFTNFAYLGKTSENIFRGEALIGVSMTGTMDNYDIVLHPVIQTNGANIVKDTNKYIAAKIGIHQAARTTCLKPEGTTSCLLGTCSGIHPHHAKRYIRRVQNNNMEVPFQFFKKFNAQATEKSVWSESGTDENILFPIEVADGSKTKNQLPAIEMLKTVKSTQENWVMNGKNTKLCVRPWLNHNVSNTIMVKKDEWDDVTKYIYENREFFTGISLIGESGDKDYPQAPFTAVLSSREIVREYGDAAIWCSGLIDMALDTYDNLWKACDAALKGYEKYEFEQVQLIDKLKRAKDKQTASTRLTNQLTWINKFDKYCNKYFGHNFKRLTYCLKDVHNWKLYCDLDTTFKSIDWIEMHETEDNTTIEQTISCANGQCELTHI